MMMQLNDDRDRERATVAALVVLRPAAGSALAMAINIWWQWQHCGTPLARCAPAQVAPCERVGEIEAEWIEIKKTGRS